MVYVPTRTLAVIAVTLFAFTLATNIFAALTYPSWYDEAFFADIAYNLFHHGVMRADVTSLDASREVLEYGPVFFHLQKAAMTALGFEPISFRILNMLGAYLVAGTVPMLFFWHTKNRNVALWLFVLLLIDSAINRSAVTGRMDMVATLFAFWSLVCAYRYANGSLLALIATASCAALAYLTTPRALFLLPAAFVTLVFQTQAFYRNTGALRIIALHYLLALLALAVPIALWVWSVGGVGDYVQSIRGDQHVLQHIGPSFFRSPEDYLLLPILCLLLVLSFKTALYDRIVVSALVTFVAFSFFVREVGPYRQMIMPYLYLAGAVMLMHILDKRGAKWVAFCCASLVLIVSLPVYFYRAADIWYVNAGCRNAESFRLDMLRNIPAGSSFLANFEFYFFLKPQARSLLAAEFVNQSHFDGGFAPEYMLLNTSSLSRPDLDRVVKERYGLVAEYFCPVRALGFDENLFNRRNLKGAKLYKKMDS